MKKLILATVCTLAFSAAAQAGDFVCRFTNPRDGSHSIYVFGPNTSDTYVEKFYWHQGRLQRREMRGQRPIWRIGYGEDVMILKPLSEPDDGGWAIDAYGEGSEEADLKHFGRVLASGRCVDHSVVSSFTPDLGY
jgi:hypothetical protein